MGGVEAHVVRPVSLLLAPRVVDALWPGPTRGLYTRQVHFLVLKVLIIAMDAFHLKDGKQRINDGKHTVGGALGDSLERVHCLRSERSELGNPRLVLSENAAKGLRGLW